MRHNCVKAQLLVLFPAAAFLYAQGNPAATRAAEIQALRKGKASHLKPETLPFVHRAVRYVQQRRLFDRVVAGSHGFRGRFGGLGPGSGFGLGPEYVRPHLFGGPGVFSTWIVGSTNGFYSGALGLRFPKLATGRFSLDFSAFRRNLPHVDYYGPGPGSAKSGRTAYDMQDTAFETRAAFYPSPHISAGGLARYLLFNTGPSQYRAYASTEQVYTPATTPGLLQQTNFISPGVFVDFDWRRFPLGRRDGARFLAEYSTFFDRGPGSYSFGQVDLDFRRYFAMLHGRRELAFRAKAVLSNATGSSGVPFYLQAQLGGPDNLRGFRGRRFYDNDSFVLNAEYRWELADRIDAALFSDTGKVFPSLSKFQPFRSLQTDYGVGLRFRRGAEVFWRVDLGFSREGPKIWLTFGDLF